MSVVYPVHNVALHWIEETAEWDATHEYGYLTNLWLVRDSSSLLEPTEKFSIFDRRSKGVPRVLVLAGSTIQTCDSSIQQHMDGDSRTWCNKELTRTRDHQRL
jgi:hypothetical protein